MHKLSSEYKVSTPVLFPPGYVKPGFMNRLVITCDAIIKLSLRWLLPRQLSERKIGNCSKKRCSFNPFLLFMFILV
jgi:hypothetical protein